MNINLANAGIEGERSEALTIAGPASPLTPTGLETNSAGKLALSPEKEGKLLDKILGTKIDGLLARVILDPPDVAGLLLALINGWTPPSMGREKRLCAASSSA